MSSKKSYKLLLTGGYSLSLLLTYLLGLLFKATFLFIPVLFAGPGFWVIESLGGHTVSGSSGHGDGSGVNFATSYWVLPYLDSIKFPAYLPLVLTISLNLLSWFIIGVILDRILKAKKTSFLGESQFKPKDIL